MPRRISIARIVGAVVAAALIAATVFFALEYRRLDRQFHEWIDARPAAIAVDLSRPCRITAPFHQTCQCSHGEAFYLAVPSADPPPNPELLQGLSGTITITDANGDAVESLEMSPQAGTAMDVDGAIILAYFHPFATGEYTVAINVHQGAAALKGSEQHLDARYVLCGLERMPALLGKCLAFVCGISGIVAGLFVTRGFIKYGISTPPRSPSDTSGNGPLSA